MENLKRKVSDKEEEGKPREKPLRGLSTLSQENSMGGGATTSPIKKFLLVVLSVNVMSLYLRRQMPLITFREEEFQAIDQKHDDLMVIFVEIEDFVVKRTLVDQEG